MLGKSGGKGIKEGKGFMSDYMQVLTTIDSAEEAERLESKLKARCPATRYLMAGHLRHCGYARDRQSRDLRLIVAGISAGVPGRG
jgi:hypothetical protein